MFSLIFLFFNTCAFTQQPVQWSVSYESKNNTIHFKATIEEGWHIYSQFVSEKAGPIPTSISFDKNQSIKLKGKTKEPKGKTEYDENFASNLKTFEKEVIFTQKIKLKSQEKVKGTLTYMACNNFGCIPPIDVPFEITIFENQNK